MRISILVSTLFLLFASQTSEGQTLTRVAYMQMATPEAVTIRWRTDVPTIGKINYGTSESNLSQNISENGATTEHEIRITGLQPDTKYYYNVTDNSGTVYHAAGADRYFKTSPTVGTRKPINIWAFGDFGDGSPGAKGVRNGYMKFINGQHTDLWLMLGDNAYPDGTDQEYQDYLFEIYQEQLKNMIVWPCPGNHDYKSIDINNNGPYYDIFTLPANGEAGGVPSGEEGYFSFDYGNIHFVSLNSEYVPWFLLDSGKMVQWLKQDLAANTQDFTIVYWHQPPYSKGSHDSDRIILTMNSMRDVVNPVIEDYDVDLVLTGHSHGYERSYLIHGHYDVSTAFDPNVHIVDNASGRPGDPYVKRIDGPNAGKGTLYNVVGCGGKLSDSGTMDYPAMYFSSEDYHGSLAITVDGNALYARFIDTTGNVLDEYSIFKLRESDTLTTSITENKSPEKALTVFPNPTDGFLNVKFYLPEPGMVSTAIYDMQSRQVQSIIDENPHTGTFMELVDIKALPTGNYVVKLTVDGKEIASETVVKD